jgi:hypothetical protein
VFGFTYGTAVSAGNVVLPATQPGSQMHFITSRHPAGDTLGFRTAINVPGVTAPSNVTVIAVSNGKPLVAVTKFGLGRAVQWTSYDWMQVAVLGPLEGMDDVVWRSIVWAARKPFVMRHLPNFVTMRMDDVFGPVWWAHTATNLGFKPYLSLFLGSISESAAADVRDLVSSGLVTTSIHSWTSDTLFYFDQQHATSYVASVVSSNFSFGTQWHTNHGIPISPIAVAHYSEMGSNVFNGLQAWNIQYLTLKNYPGTIRDSPWLKLGPYRLYEPQQSGAIGLPVYYADFLSVPGHPEFDGQFFNCATEIRDDASCNEWCPANNDIAGSIGRATRQAKRALDSLILATLFTHEWYINPWNTSYAAISPTNWLTILQTITNNLAPYNPSYVTLDYAVQYVRATRTSRLVSSAYDPGSGQVTATFSGKTDLDTLVYTYNGDDNVITNLPGTIPAFSQPGTVPVASLLPPLLSGGLTPSNSVILSWPGPAAGFALQQNSAFGTASWLAVTNPPSAVGLQLQVVLPNPGSNAFYRLAHP